MDSSSEVDESSDDDNALEGDLNNKTPSEQGSSPSLSNQEENQLQTSDFHKHYLSCSRKGQEGHSSMVDRLLEKYGTCIPNHDPRLYTATAANTKSIAGYSILAFPDFWGHLPPQEQEPMAKRPPHVQRWEIILIMSTHIFTKGKGLMNYQSTFSTGSQVATHYGIKIDSCAKETKGLAW